MATDQGHVVLFSQMKGFAYHQNDNVPVEFVRRNHVHAVDMKFEPVQRRATSPAAGPALQISPFVDDASEDLKGDLNLGHDESDEEAVGKKRSNCPIEGANRANT